MEILAAVSLPYDQAATVFTLAGRYVFVWRRGLVVDTQLWDQKVPSSSPW